MADISNKRVKALPYDENKKPLAGLVLPLVDGSGNITGWTPVAAVDQGDGTYALKVNADLTVESANIDIGDIHLLDLSNNKINPATKEAIEALEAILDGQLKIASSDDQVTGNKFINVDDEGRVRVTAEGGVVVDTVIPLGANETFTSSAVPSLPVSHIIIMVMSEQPSATKGLSIDVSTDGITWQSLEAFTVPANNLKVYTAGPAGTYFRIRYTNGPTPQSTFTLQVTSKPFFQKPSTHVIQDVISDEDDAELVKAVITGQTETGTFINAKVSQDGFLRVVSPPPQPPPGTTEVKVVLQSNVAGPVDTFIPITNGKVMTTQLVSSGAQASVSGCKVELFEDPNGDLSVLNLVTALYVDGSSRDTAISDEFTGNGVRRLVLRRTNLSGGSIEIFAAFRGFET